jgi:hypothetical protein
MFELPTIKAASLQPLEPTTDLAVRGKVANLFQNEEANGAALFIGCGMILGPIDEWAGWLPETIRLELQDELKLSHIDDDVFGRLMAMVTVMSTDLFYQDLPAFFEICNVLAGSPSMPGVFDLADVYELSSALLTAQFIDNEEEYSEEILSYIGYMLAEEGYSKPPAFLSMAIMPKSNYSLQESLADAAMLGGAIESENLRLQELEEFQQSDALELLEQIESLGIDVQGILADS